MGLTTRFHTSTGPRTLRVRSAAPFRALTSEMDQFFAPMWRSFEALPAGVTFSPRIDLAETAEEFRVSAELPGLKAEDFSVELEGDVLSLRGEKRSEKNDDEGGRYRRERSYGSFVRKLRIPVEVKTEAAKASFENGVLVITLPKADPVKVREIPIEAA